MINHDGSLSPTAIIAGLALFLTFCGMLAAIVWWLSRQFSETRHTFFGSIEQMKIALEQSIDHAENRMIASQGQMEVRINAARSEMEARLILANRDMETRVRDIDGRLRALEREVYRYMGREFSGPAPA